MKDDHFIVAEELIERLDDALRIPAADPARRALEEGTDWRPDK